MVATQDRHYILIASSLTAFSGSIMLSAINVALPAMGNDLSMSAVQLGWVTQSYALSLAIFILPFGRIADILGRRKIFTIGLVAATVSALTLALSISFPMLVALRVIQGIGIAMINSTGIALISSAYPPSERGKVLGITTAAVYVGLSIGPTIGGLLTQNFGWRSVFLLSLGLQIPAMVLLFKKIGSEWREAKGEKFDITGALIFAIMLLSIMYGFSSIPAVYGIVSILIGVLALAVFIAWELKIKSPILNIRLLIGNRLFALSSLAQFMFYGAVFSLSFIVSLYLQYIKGFSPQNAGFVLLAQPVMQVLFSPIAGRISDKIQPRTIVSVSIIIALIGLLLIFTATEGASMLLIILGLILVGLSYAFFASPNINAIMSSVDKKYYGVAAAMDSTTRAVGIASGMSVVMLLFSLQMGTAQITPEYYSDFVESVRTALLVFSGICLCCFFISLARGKVVRAQE